MKNLIIVESPGKTKTIYNILTKKGGYWKVIATRGYIKNLPKGKMGLHVGDDTFSADWEFVKGKKKLIDDIKKDIDLYENIYIATDDDPEGEKIAFDLIDEIGIWNNYKRITFTSITPDAVLDAIENPRSIDKSICSTAKNRRYVDRDEGYGISDLMKKDFKNNGISFPAELATGRVIAPTLQMLVDVEKQIKTFVPEEYIRVKIRYAKDGVKFEFLDTKRFMYASTEDQIALKLFKNKILLPFHEVIGHIPKLEEIAPPEPLYTATLQSSVFYTYGYNGKKTMSLAQDLFDNGLITYHRGDSNVISDKGFEEIMDYLYDSQHEDDILDEKRVYKKRKNAKESHEAIRPAVISVDTSLPNIAKRLYNVR